MPATRLPAPPEVEGDFFNEMGGGQAVIHDAKTGVNYGARDPRKDGAGGLEPHPYLK